MKKKLLWKSEPKNLSRGKRIKNQKSFLEKRDKNFLFFVAGFLTLTNNTPKNNKKCKISREKKNQKTLRQENRHGIC